MDPLSVIGLAAGAVQFADVGGRGFLGLIELLKRLKDTPKRMTELFQDVDKSIQRIYALRSAMQQPTSLFMNLSNQQIQRMTSIVEDAHQATVDLQLGLEPLFRKPLVSWDSWPKRAWRSVVSIHMERSVAEKINRIQRLNVEIMGEMQLFDLDIGADLKYLVVYGCSQECTANAVLIQEFICSDTGISRSWQTGDSLSNQLLAKI